jgi:hypothetical protein
LVGTTEARVVLEAIIADRENTATDRATGKVGADRVRALIARHPGVYARLLLLPSRRVGRHGSRLAGDPAGPGAPTGPLRPARNKAATLAGGALGFVPWTKIPLALACGRLVLPNRGAGWSAGAAASWRCDPLAEGSDG